MRSVLLSPTQQYRRYSIICMHAIKPPRDIPDSSCHSLRPNETRIMSHNSCWKVTCIFDCTPKKFQDLSNKVTTSFQNPPFEVNSFSLVFYGMTMEPVISIRQKKLSQIYRRQRVYLNKWRLLCFHHDGLLSHVFLNLPDPIHLFNSYV